MTHIENIPEWWSNDIFGGTVPIFCENMIFTACGREKVPEDFTLDSANFNKLSSSELETHLLGIECMFTSYEYGYIGLEILGYLMITSGCSLVEPLKSKIIKSAKKDVEVHPFRTEAVSDLIKAIEEYDGTPVSISVIHLFS